MATYAALLSLTNTIQQINNHPRPPLSLPAKQAHSLTQHLAFLQEFLERYSSSGSEQDDHLESRIADAAHAAEDVIESHIVGGSTSHGADLYQGLERVIQDMDLIKKEVMVRGHDHHLPRTSQVSTDPTRSISGVQTSAMVDFGDIVNKILDKLTGLPNYIRIIPIVGMGGTGKTTLARSIYANPLVVQHFDLLAWVTISLEYSRREILKVLCRGLGVSTNDLSEDQFGESVHKRLWGRRYLIVMDDIWNSDAWDEVVSFYPDNNNGSRIIITTRLSNLAFQLSGSHDFQMKFLDEDKSWNLLSEIVFGKEGCPAEFESIGKEIARNCRGLPLSIVVIGGLLAKSKMTERYWEYILKNLNSLINLENNQHCLQILHTSYKELPIHLKPCFLYMGLFPEDEEIRASDLIRLWVAEGILKPIDGKSLEEAAEEYVKELTLRNLVLVHKLGSKGNVKSCRIHDLLRDLCLREAQKKFVCLLGEQDLIILEGMFMGRRILVGKDTPKEHFLHALTSTSLARILLLMKGCHEPSASFACRLLRVYCSRLDHFYGKVADLSFIEAIFRQANLRYLSIKLELSGMSIFPFSWSFLWNLHTLEVNSMFPIMAPPQFWELPLLRHAILDRFQLPDPHQESIVMENLQTLSGIRNFRCSEEVVNKIPNIKTLKLDFSRARLHEGCSNFCLHNLARLQKLESYDIYYSDYATSSPEIFRNLTFPNSLKKLTLFGTRLHWEDLTTKIGSLLHLQVLKLLVDACIGSEWETIEGEFCSLQFLLIDACCDLKYWITDSSHLPRLERLVLQHLEELEEIPSSIGDIPTLQLIQLKFCSKSAADSARRIKEEQEGNDNLDLQVLIGQN